MLSRRQLLVASPATLPLFLALSGCWRPAALSDPPPVSEQTTMLLHAASAEQDLIWIYGQAAAVHPPLAPALAPLLAEHREHLAQLRSRVAEPPGRRLPGTVTSWAGGREPAIPATRAGALAQLRDAERAAVATLMSRLGGASPSLAQLYASIAACESTHVTALTDRIGA